MEKFLTLLGVAIKLLINSIPLLCLVLVALLVVWLFCRLIAWAWNKRKSKKQQIIVPDPPLPPPAPEPEPPRVYVHYLKMALEDLENLVLSCRLEFGRFLLGADAAVMRKQLEADGSVVYFNDSDAERPGLELQLYESRVARLEKIISYLQLLAASVSDKQVILPKDIAATIKNPTRSLFNATMTIKAGTALEIITEEGEQYLVKVAKSVPNAEAQNNCMFFLDKVQWEAWRQLLGELQTAAEKSLQKYNEFLPAASSQVEAGIDYIKSLLERAAAAEAEKSAPEPTAGQPTKEE